MHPCAKFHEPEVIDLDFKGQNTFGVRALEKEKNNNKKKNKLGETLKGSAKALA